MERTIKKLFYEVSEQQYYVFYQNLGSYLLFKVDNVNPIMLSRVIETAWFNTSYERSKVIEEMEIFVKNELTKINDNF